MLYFIFYTNKKKKIIGNLIQTRLKITKKSMKEDFRILELPEGEKNWEEEVIQCSVPVIVDFYTEWCGPCKSLTPAIEDYFKQEQSFKLVKVNVDKHNSVAEKYNVSNIPSVFLFDNGTLVCSFVGNNKVELIRMIGKTKGNKIL